MSAILQFDLSGDGGDLRNRMATLQNPRGLMAAAGGTVRRALQDHFIEKDAVGNRQGWPSRHTWRRISRATQLTSVSATEAVITVAAPELNLKINGGEIKPKRGKALAIPANAEAYRAGSPRESGMDLVSVVLGNVARGKCMGALVRPASQSVSFRKTKHGTKAKAGKLTAETVMYWLVSGVRVPKDPTALPPVAKIQSAIDQATREWLATQTRRATS